MILCLGTTPIVQRTLTFAHVEIDEVNRAASVRQTASGGSIDVARALHQLGKEVLAVGFLGGDAGKLIRQELDREGVPNDFLEVTAETLSRITLRDQSTGVQTDLLEAPPAVEAKAYVKLLREFDANLWRANAVVLSDSLPLEAPADFYERCIEKANGQSVPVVLDAPMTGKPLVIRLNAQTEAEFRAVIPAIIESGARWATAVVGNTVNLSDGAQWWRIYSPVIHSNAWFTAGLAAGISAGENMPDACALAAACGAVELTTALDPAVVKILLSQVRVEKM